jgi:hypothetical protein
LISNQEILDSLNPEGGNTIFSTLPPWKLQLNTNILESPADKT